MSYDPASDSLKRSDSQHCSFISRENGRGGTRINSIASLGTKGAMKEKSKNAARNRREKENAEFFRVGEIIAVAGGHDFTIR
ncbi:hypothetical protein NQ317_014417 [Molorchus minor]|uniref:Uncharacterized protein n=1 Tax=Molorchus minor TaxID=1323400 RepID=A0ABQ9K7C7_9CUCU|nr:hypothetical protein NQ317_014417 [Molorchus minor]